jgi:integrase
VSKRRGKGEGSITQRSDGRWMGRLDLGWRDGKRRYKAVYGKTRREVVDRLRTSLSAAQQGTLISDERQTLGEYLTRWLADVARTRVRPRTYAGYEGTIERHIKPHLGKARLAKLTPQQVQAWLSTLEGKGVSAGRRRYARVVLRMALNTAMRWRVVSVNSATLIDAPRTTQREIRPLTPEQATTLLSAARDHSLEAFITVALGCGLRLGEALGLQWSDIDLEVATLRVTRAVQRFGGDAKARRPLLAERKRLRAALAVLEAERKHLRAGKTAVAPEAIETRQRLVQELQGVRTALAAVKTSVQFTEPKSSRSRRTIALPGVAIAALKAHRVRQLEARLAAGGRWQESGLVFTSSLGTAWEPRNVTRQFKALLNAAKLPNIRLHDLRHSCATLMLAQGVSPRTIMETLGHSQISLTLNTYSHVLPSLQEDAAAKMNAILSRS